MARDIQPGRQPNGDLILLRANGRTAMKFQADGPFVSFFDVHGHPADVLSMPLPPDLLTELRDWCDEQLGTRA